MPAVTAGWRRKNICQEDISFWAEATAPAIAPAIITRINLFIAGQMFSFISHLIFTTMVVNADSHRKIPVVRIAVKVQIVLVGTEWLIFFSIRVSRESISWIALLIYPMF